MTFLSNHHQIPKAMLTDIEKARIIKRAVCEHYGMDMSQLCTRSHKREYADVRNVIYYFLRTKTGLSLREMGGYFDRDHATAYHGHRNTENLMRYNGLGKTIEAIDRAIEQEIDCMSTEWVNHIGTMITNYETA